MINSMLWAMNWWFNCSWMELGHSEGMTRAGRLKTAITAQKLVLF